MPTALVTGATSGIGAAFVERLAADGRDLVIVARDRDRLEATASAARGHGVAVEVLPADLAVPTDRDRVAERVGAVDLLVNNAGFGNHGHFLEVDTESEAEMVRVNCEAVVILTHAFVPAMVERGRGGVITVASTAGFQPLPYETTYSASKAFAKTFMDALNIELKGTGVKAMSVNPGPVPTEWQEIAKIPEESIPPGSISAEECVAQSLRAYERGKRQVVPGFLIRNMMRFNAPAPTGLKLKVAERMYRPKED